MVDDTTKRKISLENEIEITRKRLISKVKRFGLPENFGLKEIRKLEDKYGFILLCYSVNPIERQMSELIHNFYCWCNNYTGRE
jgi:hypothetical protein